MGGATIGHVFDYKSKTSGPKGTAVTVVNRMDTPAEDMIADITDSPPDTPE